MQILERENLEKIIENYGHGVPMYNIIAGCTSETISMQKYYKQAALVDRLMRTVPNGWFEQGTPKSTFLNSGEFCHVISRDFNLQNVAHRLYFNIGDNDVEFATEFLNRCRYINKIPHYLKFDKYYKRDDGLVIYVDDEHLAETIAIIEQIGKDCPEFKVNNGMPLATYDCGWYGYGKELKTAQLTSFNSNVAGTVKNVLGQLMSEMGYEVFDMVRTGPAQVVNEVDESKVIDSLNKIIPYLQDENYSNQFYLAFRDRLVNALYNQGLLLTDQTVPYCISELNKENGLIN